MSIRGLRPVGARKGYGHDPPFILPSRTLWIHAEEGRGSASVLEDKSGGRAGTGQYRIARGGAACRARPALGRAAGARRGFAPGFIQTRPAARARAYARHLCPGRRSEPEKTPSERSQAQPLLRPEHLPPARAPDPVPETALTSDAAPGYCETRPYPHGPAARYAPALPYRSPATLRTCSGRRVPSTRRGAARTRAAV